MTPWLSFLLVGHVAWKGMAGMAGLQAGCKMCKPGKDEDCYEGGSCFSAGSQQQCLDLGGEYCVTDFSCQDCIAKEMDCYQKNWALPCYAVGSEESCKKLGSQWCGTPAEDTASLQAACQDCRAKEMDCYHKNWALPCYAVGSEEGCKKLGSHWCGTTAEDTASPQADLPLATQRLGHGQVEADPGNDHLLLIAVVAAAAAAPCLVGACLGFYIFLVRSKTWTFEKPIDSDTENSLKSLENKLEGGARVLGCGRGTDLQHQKDCLLAKAALKVAGGPEFWSLTVQDISKFLEDNKDYLKEYCQWHALGQTEAMPKCKHICLKEGCSMDHGDMIYEPHKPGEIYTPLIPNMHVVVSSLIKPQTKAKAPKKGSNARGILGKWAFLTEGRIQRATTFVSHCWNEKFKDFVDTLQSLGPKEDVWICSFALPQNINISEVLGNKPSKSPFARALKKSDQVLLAVDERVEPPSRSWCCFELYLACKQRKPLRIEVPTQESEQTFLELKKKIKARMEQVDISKCQASNQGDHKQIMDEIRFNVGEVNSRLAEKAEVEYLSACRNRNVSMTSIPSAV